MTTFPDGVYQFGGAAIGAGLPEVISAGGKWYWCDPTHGTAGGSGESLADASNNLATLYAKLRDGYNDGIFFVGGATAYNPSSSITWSKSYAHLIGLSGGLPGMGQRCRIVGTTGNDLNPVITISGSACVFQNLQFFQGADKDEDSGNVVVSGDRNLFKNVFFAGMGHATPAARAGAYNLKVTGSENAFANCTIGLDTIVRAAANYELIISGGKNSFYDCDIRAYTSTANKLLVKVDASAADLRDTIFQDCLFYAYSQNWGTSLTNAFTVAGSNTHFIILKGNCQFVGCSGIADVITHIYGAGPVPNAGMFLSTNPTT